MIGPALAYGGGAMAANAAGSSPGEAADAVTPSLLESGALGFMTASHSTGLQSGGLVGYSTFFTGYRPEDHGVGRALSLGRVAGKGVSLAGKALQHTPLTEIPGAERQLKRMAQFDKYGLSVFSSRPAKGGGGIVGSYEDSALRRDGQGRRRKVQEAINRSTQGARAQSATPRQSQNKVKPTQDATLRHFSRSSNMGPEGAQSAKNRLENTVLREGGDGFDASPRRGSSSNVDDVLRKNARVQSAGDMGLRPPGSQTTKATMMGRSVAGLETPDSPLEASDTPKRSFWYKAMSILGGEGASADGSAARSKTVYDEYLDEYISKADPNARTKGMNIAGGSAGRFVGAAFRGVAIYEAARLIGQGAAYAAGEGYEAMVNTTTRLRRRVGQDDSMSGGYFNRAASTERQRAVQTLNNNRLDPKTQMMGNEASFGHKV